MKIISVVIPTYNEEENILDVYNRVHKLFTTNLTEYSHEILFIDNYSTDNSRELISRLCQKDLGVKAIYNAKNFGFTRSTFYGLTQATGDCAVLLFADSQDPPEIIPEFVRQWEYGRKLVIGIKNKSKENPLMYHIRKCYYKIIKSISDVDQIEQFDGFGLYDKSFIEILRKLDDPLPYLRGIVAELGYERKDIFYEQEKRRKGKSSFNFFKLFDMAMLGITSYSKVIMRLATFLGFIISALCLIIAIITFVIKLFYWDKFPVGTAAISIGVFLLGSLILFFIGLLGEYIMNINTRVIHRPLVIEEKRINFNTNEQDGCLLQNKNGKVAK